MPPDTLDFRRAVSFRALRPAALRAARGKRRSPGVTAFLADLETECLRLERELLAGTWRPGKYVAFEIRDPKPRIVSAAAFRDRVVHHALCAVVEPVFERGFIFDSYANRRDKGTHAAIDRYEQFARRNVHVLRCDIFRYFPAIDHEILKSDLRRRIDDNQILTVLDAIVDGSNRQEPVDVYFPGDTLWAPYERRRGLPIGNLTSQFFANVYLDPLDHFVKEVLRVRGYLRYVDDFALFHDDLETLCGWRIRIEKFLAGRRLLLHPRKTAAVSTREPSAFLGIVLANDGRRRLPEDNVARFRGRYRAMRDRFNAGAVTFEEIAPRVRAWIAHAEHADTWRLRQTLFRGGPFESSLKPDGPQRPCGLCAAVPGTTIRGTSARQIATGTSRTIATTTSAFASPVRSHHAGAAPSKDGAGARGSVQGPS
nr:RNA-directed DNA polymerase [Methylocapsa sp. S129]